MKIQIIQHVSFESPGSILQWADKQGAQVSFTNVFDNDPYPADIDFDLLVVMGGPMGANDDQVLPWIRAEKRFISETLAAGRKILGVCLGSQLLASVLNAKVYPNKEKEIGWLSIQKEKDTDCSLTEDFPAEWICLHWHGDTYDLPDGAVRLFRSAACINQGYLYNNQALALQFHMEATPSLVSGMVAHGRNELQPFNFVQDEQTILNNHSHFDENRILLYRMLDRFIAL